MRRLALAPIFVCALLSPPAAFALGIGDVEVQSALNQPLDAEIPLRGVSADEADDIIVALASEEAFRRVGLDRPFSLTGLDFKVVAQGGESYIQITSSKPIIEPFLSFLLEVDAPQGNLLREYTILLDPPVFASGGGHESRDEVAAAEPTPAAVDTAAAPSDADLAQVHGASVQGTMQGRIDDAPQGMPDTPPEPQAAEHTKPAAEHGVGEPAPVAEAEAEAEPEPEGTFGDTPVFLQVARAEEAAERRLAEAAAAAAPTGTAIAPPSPADSGGPAMAESEAEAETKAPASRDEHVPVQEGQTLWGIADQLRRGDITVQQMMIALLRYNPEAFVDNNINRLKQGYVLQVPDAEAVRSVPAQRAITQVREQNGLWRKWRDGLDQGGATQMASANEAATGASGPSTGAGRVTGEAVAGGEGRLDIVGADKGGATSDQSASATASADGSVSEQLQLAREKLASVRAEREDLAGRVEQLEGTVDKMEQLITVREEQLARLQQQLEELQKDAASTAASGAAAQGADAEGVATDAGTEAVASQTSGSPGDQAASSGDAEKARAQTTASGNPPKVVGTPTAPAEKSWLDSIFGFVSSVVATVSSIVAGLAAGGLMSPVVLGAAALLVFLLLLLVVRRRRAAQAFSDDELVAPVAADAYPDDEFPTADIDPTSASSTATGDVVDLDDPDVADDAASALMDEDFDLSTLDVDANATGGAGAGEKDDTLAEADTYLAYGLHQQAEDLLRLALEESPTRLDYHEKLLETLYAAGKSNEFASAADHFRNRLDDPADAAWQRVSVMGRKIAPQHALFAAAGSQTADDLDFDLSTDHAAGDASVDSFTQVLLSEAENADSFDDMPDLDAPTSTPAGGGPADAGAADSDQGLDFDLDDLGGDLGLDSSPAGAAGSGAATQGGAKPGGASTDSGLDFDLGDLGDLGDIGDLEAAAGSAALDGAPSSAPAMAASSSDADDSSVMDFDFSSIEQVPGQGDDAPAVQGADDGAADDGLEDLATMLDLAKAYIDMGDAESATNALQEVIAGGNDEQRAEARNLLETVQ